MKNESVEQLNALKSCPFSPGCDMKWTTSDVSSENTCTGISVIQKTQNLNPESFKCSFNRFKKNNLQKMESGPFWRVGRGGAPVLFFMRPYLTLEQHWYRFQFDGWQHKKSIERTTCCAVSTGVHRVFQRTGRREHPWQLCHHLRVDGWADGFWISAGMVCCSLS